MVRANRCGCVSSFLRSIRARGPGWVLLLCTAFLLSAPVLAERSFASLPQLTALIGPSRFIRPGHMTQLRELCLRMGDDADKRCAETDPTGLMEGLYIKIEQGGYVRERMKFVRAAFVQCIDFGETNWLEKMILPNQLACPLDALFEPRLPRKEGS